jgi:hypothetical protein
LQLKIEISNVIQATRLTRLELAKDGSHFTLQGIDVSDLDWSLRLPSEFLRQLILTLPNLALTSMQLQHGDSTLRIVYPADACTLELASDGRTIILTLGTADGFHVSFGLSDEQCKTIGDSVRVARLASRDVARPS